MKRILPENGYESPQLSDGDILFGQGILSGERKRVGRRKSTDNGEKVESPGSQAHLNGGGHLNGGSETTQHKIDDEGERPKTKVGFRDRVACFTWTWFTMTMATGGIANVIHSSNILSMHSAKGGLL